MFKWIFFKKCAKYVDRIYVRIFHLLFLKLGLSYVLHYTLIYVIESCGRGTIWSNVFLYLPWIYQLINASPLLETCWRQFLNLDTCNSKKTNNFISCKEYTTYWQACHYLAQGLGGWVIMYTPFNVIFGLTQDNLHMDLSWCTTSHFMTHGHQK